jgi:hypothetical protein
MEFFHNLKDKWNILWEKCSPVLRTIGTVFAAIGRAIGTLCKYIFRLRALFMAIPVAVIAVIEAMINTSRLPDTLEYATIGLDFDATQTLFGPFVMHIEQLSRETAVMGPLMLTAACLVFTIFSKRTLFPWIVSIFTLVVPVLLYLMTQYPA